MVTGTAARPELDTGVAEVDVEHQLQVQLIEAVKGAVSARRDRATVSALLEQLQDASSIHFMSEELMMRLHAWPRYQAHVEAHGRLLEDLATLRRDLETGLAVEHVVALDQLQSWLTDHIRVMDRAFAREVARTRSP
jgi:hemerythrin